MELGFRKTSEILDELKAEKSRLERKAKKSTGSSSSLKTAADVGVAQGVTQDTGGDKGLSKKEKAAQKKQQKYIKELEANLNAAKEGTVPLQEFEKLKNDYVQVSSHVRYILYLTCLGAIALGGGGILDTR